MKSSLVVILACAALGAAGAAAVWALREEPAPAGGHATGPAAPHPEPDPEDTGSPRWPPRDPNEKLVPIDPVPHPDTPPPRDGDTRPTAPMNLDDVPQPIPVELGDPTRGEPGRGMRFVFGDLDATAKVDWLQVGIRLRESLREIRKSARRVAQGDQFEELDHIAADAVLLQMQFLEPFAHALRDPDPEPEFRFGAVVSHPAYESNAMAGLLESANRPLTDAQVDALQPVWTELAEAYARHRGDPRKPWDLAGLIAWSRARAAAQTRLESALDDGQRGIVWPPEIRGRVYLDRFGPGMAWLQRIHRVTLVKERPLEELVTDRMYDVTQTRDAVGQRKFTARVKTWIDTLPEAWRQGASGGLGRRGFATWEEFDAGLDGLPEIAAELAASIPRETGPGAAKPLTGAMLIVRTDR